MRKELLVVSLLLCFSFYAAAQEMPEPAGNTYLSEDGKLYIQKNLPVYLYISGSADSNAVKYRLRSKKTAQYTNPMHFDTDGVNYLKVYSSSSDIILHNQDKADTIAYPVYADCRAPETYGIFNSSISGFINGIKTYPKGTQLSLLEYDAVSGTSKIYYSINQAPFKVYTEALEFNDTLTVHFQFFGVDHVGNSEKPQVLNFIIE